MNAPKDVKLCVHQADRICLWSVQDTFIRILVFSDESFAPASEQMSPQINNKGIQRHSLLWYYIYTWECIESTMLVVMVDLSGASSLILRDLLLRPLLLPDLTASKTHKILDYNKLLEFLCWTIKLMAVVQFLQHRTAHKTHLALPDCQFCLQFIFPLHLHDIQNTRLH